MRAIAGIYRRRFLARTRIVAVVGSLGKTTTRHTVAKALDCPDRNFSYSNYGSSLAENLMRVRPRDAHAVLEAGISRPGQMAPSAKMIQPDVVVVTSIKSDHLLSFPTLFDTREEKVKMVRALSPGGIAVLNGDDPHVRWMATQTKASVVTFGLNADNDVRASNVGTDSEGRTFFEVQLAGTTHEVRTHLAGQHMIYPVLAAIVTAHLEKIDLAAAISRLAKIVPVTSRMELIKLPNGIQILDDSFKSSLESVYSVFETFSKMPATRKIVLIGTVIEASGKERDIYRDWGNKLARFADLIVCVGSDELTSLRAAAVRAGMKASAITIAGSRVSGLADLLRSMLKPGDLVLIKGPSTQRLRRVVLQLMGTEVSCTVKYCGVKVSTCDVCPLRTAPEAYFKNYFINRYIKF